MATVRSLGVTTLVALMSAHRAAAEQSEPPRKSFDQALIEAIEADLRNFAEGAQERLARERLARATALQTSVETP